MIYFVQNETTGAVKIGRSKNVSQRLRGMQTANVSDLDLLATAEGGRDRERELHEIFADARIDREWFWLTPELERCIRSFADEPVTFASGKFVSEPGNDSSLQGCLLHIFDDDGRIYRHALVLHVRDGTVTIDIRESVSDSKRELNWHEIATGPYQIYRNVDQMRDAECDIRQLTDVCECVRCSPEYWAEDLVQAYRRDGWIGYETQREQWNESPVTVDRP